MDDCDCDTPRDLWSVFYDFYIDAPTFDVIRQQCEKLVQLSVSRRTWAESKYNHCLQVVNTDTLNVLRHYWSQYMNPVNSTPAVFHEFKAAVEKCYNTAHKNLGSIDFCRSCGPYCIYVQSIESKQDFENHVKTFWKYGTIHSRDITDRQHCNPLFKYSSASGSRFSVHKHTCPFLGFHLATSLSKLTRDSPFYQGNQRDRCALDVAAEAVAMQFQSWCNAFRRAVRESQRPKNPGVRIRFFVGDANGFCIGLNRLQDGKIVNWYSRPWSAQALYIDGDDSLPTSFNVIDTSTIIENVGLLNLFPNVIPLLQVTTSVLYTSMLLRNVKDESNLLNKILCADVASMCTFLGIVPTAYVTGVTTVAYLQDNPTPDHTSQPVVGNRMTWKLVTSGDTEVNVARAIPHCSAEELATFLFDVYRKMFPHEFLRDAIMDSGDLIDGAPRVGTPCYTRNSFASLVAFVKRRVYHDSSGLDWGRFEKCMIRKITADKDVLENVQDLFLHFHLNSVVLSSEITGVRLHNYRHNSGILKYQNPPGVIAVILTVPRHKIRPIYEKIAKDGKDLTIVFQLHVSTERGYSKFSSIQLIFGKLTSSQNGLTGIIEEDLNGWHGSSDLHLCTYLLTRLCLRDDPRKVVLSARLSPEIATAKAFERQMGDDLEVFEALLFDDRHVHLFESLPGLQPPSSVSNNFAHGEYSAQTEFFRVTYPRFGLKNGVFTTFVTYMGDNQQKLLRKKGAFTISQTSPCTATLTCGTLQHVCSFPFPVTDIRIEVERATSIIKVIAPLVTTSSRGYYSSTQFPLIRRSDSMICSWNLPYINFRKYPKLDISEADSTAWINPHVVCMFSDRELTLRGTKLDLMTNVKNAIHAIMLPTTSVIRLRPAAEDDFPIIIFCTGLYLDYNSHSIIREGYVLPVTMNLAAVQQSISADEITVGDLEMKFWRSALPAMAERCREWEHTTLCEYSSEIPVSLDKGTRSFCSCGMGTVGKEFSSVDIWNKFTPHVTRVAIPTLFAPAYIERTRGFYHAFANGISEEMGIFGYMNPITDDVDLGAERSRCKVCWKKAGTKCGKCMQATYCSRVCQQKDWKVHKPYCKPPEAK